VSKTFGEWYQKTNKTEDARAAAIQERVTAVLRSIPKEAFADSFQKLYERCQPFVVKDDYFKGQ
jgi:methylmalonyl-CoA mutase cobalamin-binding subunit